VNQGLEEVFADVFKFMGKLTDNLSPEHIKGWNSLGHLALVTALEERFGVAIADEDSMEMEDVGRIKAVLRRLGIRE
jgi:acyl carrier protein